MDESFKIIGGASGYVEIEIDDDFTYHPSFSEIQMLEKNCLLIKHLEETAVNKKRSST